MKNMSFCLWYDGRAEEAMNFYTAAFTRSKRGNVTPVTSSFQLEGLDFLGLNGGPLYHFTPANSFFISCDNRQELEGLWHKLSDGGSVLMPLDTYPFSELFGWVQDKFGLSWQLNLAPRSQKLAPCLMFAGKVCGKAEEAARFYTTVFPDSAVGPMAYYQPGEPGAEGTVKHGVFTLGGQEFMVMDSNHDHGFTFSGALSFYIPCETQEQVDYYWNKLSEGGKILGCGWLDDRYGVTWQVVPTILSSLIGGPDPERSKRVMTVMMKMQKLVIHELQEAYDGVLQK